LFYLLLVFAFFLLPYRIYGEIKLYIKGPFAVITQKCNKTANINVKKLQFIHKLTASDTSKTAKITKRFYSAAH